MQVKRKRHHTEPFRLPIQKEGFTIDDEISHLTKLRSEPCEKMRRGMPNGRKLPISTAKMIAGREANLSGRGKFSSADCSHVLGRYLPVNDLWCFDGMDSKAYVSQFSADGSVLVAGFQASRIKIYNVDNGLKLQKDIIAKSLEWTITDTSLSPDQRNLVYSSLSPLVHIVNVETAGTESHANITDIHDGLDFSEHENDDFSFGIFSVKFSTDGRELVAGSNDDAIYIYDLEANKVTSRFEAHLDDVNTVTFADETGNLIYSGSDDTLCKIWDRRCFFTRGGPAGVLSGHTEGITFIDSRRDGRYFISNGKDQSIKLWDIRRLSTDANSSRPRASLWDYRLSAYPREYRYLRHPNDQSLATYRGHSVLRTLIRCYFSPAHSTGQRYIYTGSHDKHVYIYDVVTGDQVAKLAFHNAVIRDCSWHPYYPMLVSSSWDCQIARWQFSGSDAVPSVVDNKRHRRQQAEQRTLP
ncbi:uncharacterized protein A4U43_C02F20230 [Asparagus officinalis]|uniref:Uncharacterized protein n=1 Tax=Asparagus officinalis TaxID=4686 RepID=A0A5P1FKE5_ASPOF|nr:LEC14B protein-like [Asparagus officinalis]ONK78572.1 uncharacterized protein A4U43_C02F20230 [Asparagus officinalis]